MKQGRAPTVVSGTKVEPKANVIGVGATSNIGVKQVLTKSQPLYKGRGLEAPMHSQKTHKSGSQGKF